MPAGEWRGPRRPEYSAADPELMRGVIGQVYDGVVLTTRNRKSATGFALEAHRRTGTCRASARAQAWELARYRAYQTCLAGQTLGKTFGQAVAFLTLIGANAASRTDAAKSLRSRP
jgi:hypothetical protein